LGETGKAREDVIYRDKGDYISVTSDQIPDTRRQLIQYPFAGVSRETVEDVTYSDLGNGVEQVAVTGVVETTVGQMQVVVPGFSAGQELKVAARARYEDGVVRLIFSPLLTLHSGETVVGQIQPLTLRVIPPERLPRVYVSLNGVVFEVADGEETAGQNLTLRVGEKLVMEVFDAADPTGVPTEALFEATTMNQCWTRSDGGKPHISEVIEGMARVMTVGDASGCLSMRLGEFGQDAAVLSVSLPFRSPNGGKPHFCVNQEGAKPYRCIHDDVFYTSETSQTWSEVTRLMVAEAFKAYWIDVIGRPPDAVGGEWTIAYQAPEVAWYPRVAVGVFEADFWAWLAAAEFEIPEGSEKLTAMVETKPDKVRITQAGKRVVENCDLFDRGSVDKLVSGEAVVYEARDRGAACDRMALASERTDKEYLLRLWGESQSGRPLKMYVYNNAAGRNDLEVLLPTGAFDSSYPLLSWPLLAPADYSAALENRSFGREVSRNRLDGMAVYPVPLVWISKITVQPKGSGFGGEMAEGQVSRDSQLATREIQNTLQIQNVQKYGTSHYRVVVGHKPQATSDKQTGLVALGQGYDAGWIAYQIPDTRNQISVIAPWWFGERLEHVKVNGWGNGFLVTSDQIPETSSHIVIVYWPQYLEWGGLLLLVGTFGFLGLNLLKNGLKVLP
jgi:hypothetical protein